MASSFGGTIKLQGESEYKRALNDITSQLRLLSSEMRLTASDFTKGENAMETMKNKSKTLNAQIDQQVQKIIGLSDAVRMSSEAYGESDKRTIAWKAKLNEAKAELNNLNKSLDDNEKEMKEYSDSADNASESSSRLGDIIKGQLISQAVIGGIRMLGSAMKQVGTALIDVGKQAIASYSNYEQLVGGVKTLLGTNEMTIEEYAQSVGKTVEEVADQYQYLVESENMVFENAKKAYKTAGLSANEYMEQVTSFSASLLQSLGGDTKKATEVADMAIIDMSDNANKMGTDMQRITDAYQGFAKQNYTMLDNLKLGYGGTKGEMERLLADAQALSGIEYDISNLSDVYEAIHVIQTSMGITNTTMKEGEKTIEGSTKSMIASWKNLITGIADDNADFQSLVDAFVNNLVIASENMLPRITQAVKGVGQLIAGLGKAILDNLPMIIEKGKELIMGIGNGITQAIPTIIPIVKQLIESLGTFIKEQAPLLIQQGVGLIKDMGEGLIEGIPNFISNALDLLQELADFLTENAPLLINAGISFIRNMVQGLVQALPELIARVPALVSQFANVINDNAPTIIQAGIGLIWDIIKGLISAIPDLIANLPQIIQAIIDVWQAVNWLDLGSKIITGIGNGFTAMKEFAKNAMGNVKEGIINFIKDLPSNLFKIGKNAISNLGGAIQSMLGWIKTKALSIGTGVLNSIKDMLSWDNIKSVGVNLVKGLWNGISDMTGWVLDKINGFGKSVLGGIKKFFGIKSPSKVFKEQVGKNLALGLGEGFSDTMDEVTDDMARSIPTEFETPVVKKGSTDTVNGGNLVGAMVQALKGVKVVMNDREMGSFVVDTVGKVVYS